MRDTFPVVIYDDEKESEEMRNFVNLMLTDRKKPLSVSILTGLRTILQVNNEGGFPAFHKEFPTLCNSHKKALEMLNKGKKGVAKNSKKPKQFKGEVCVEEDYEFTEEVASKETDPKLDVAQA